MASVDSDEFKDLKEGASELLKELFAEVDSLLKALDGAIFRFDSAALLLAEIFKEYASQVDLLYKETLDFASELNRILGAPAVKNRKAANKATEQSDFCHVRVKTMKLAYRFGPDSSRMRPLLNLLPLALIQDEIPEATKEIVLLDTKGKEAGCKYAFRLNAPLADRAAQSSLDRRFSLLACDGGDIEHEERVERATNEEDGVDFQTIDAGDCGFEESVVRNERNMARRSDNYLVDDVAVRDSGFENSNLIVNENENNEEVIGDANREENAEVLPVLPLNVDEPAAALALPNPTTPRQKKPSNRTPKPPATARPMSSQKRKIKSAEAQGGTVKRQRLNFSNLLNGAPASFWDRNEDNERPDEGVGTQEAIDVDVFAVADEENVMPITPEGGNEAPETDSAADGVEANQMEDQAHETRPEAESGDENMMPATPEGENQAHETGPEAEAGEENAMPVAPEDRSPPYEAGEGAKTDFDLDAYKAKVRRLVGQDGEAVDFAAAMSGGDRADIARCFYATLFLATSEKIDIQQINDCILLRSNKNKDILKH